MKFQFYTSTPGLIDFPREQRFRVWRAAHRKLQQSDSSYRHEVHRGWLRILVPIIVSVLLQLLPLGVALQVNLNLICLVSIIYFSFCLQTLMNERVGKELKERQA